MELNKKLVAYELAHNLYMGDISETQPQRRDYVTAYDTIEELLNLHGFSSITHTTVSEHEYKVHVFIDGERFEYIFAY